MERISGTWPLKLLKVISPEHDQAIFQSDGIVTNLDVLSNHLSNKVALFGENGKRKGEPWGEWAIRRRKSAIEGDRAKRTVVYLVDALEIGAKKALSVRTNGLSIGCRNAAARMGGDVL